MYCTVQLTSVVTSLESLLSTMEQPTHAVCYPNPASESRAQAQHPTHPRRIYCRALDQRAHYCCLGQEVCESHWCISCLDKSLWRDLEWHQGLDDTYTDTALCCSSPRHNNFGGGLQGGGWEMRIGRGWRRWIGGGLLLYLVLLIREHYTSVIP